MALPGNEVPSASASPFEEAVQPVKSKRGLRLLVVLLVGSGVLCLLAVGVLVFGVMRYRPMQMVGRSMEPTLHERDRVMFSRDVSNLQRGDMVVFYYPEDPAQSYVMRLVGLPEETIEIRDRQTLINGQILAEPYIATNMSAEVRDNSPLQLGSDEYFVMGDSRGRANDSTIWGPLKRDAIWGKYVWTYWSSK
jgi:signal peptidase I